MNIGTPGRIPFDGVVKPLLLTAHFIGFGVLLGAVVIGQEPTAAFWVLTVVSGLLLIAREILHEGLVWFRQTEGLLTAAKVLLLGVAVVFSRCTPAVISFAVLLGALTSHLPKDVRERVWWGGREE